jgi:MSHA pilin protein MshA
MKEKGFTLIELVVVIVILGILAATALPKFMDLRGDAVQSAVNGVAGALSSAAAINYSTRLITPSNGYAVTNCQAVSNALQAGSLPSTEYAITSLTVSTNATNNNAVCTVSATINGTTKTANFTAIGIS